MTSPVRQTWCTAHWMARMLGNTLLFAGVAAASGHQGGKPDAIMATLLSSEHNRIE